VLAVFIIPTAAAAPPLGIIINIKSTAIEGII
jgi:hypothetical protein